MLYVARKKAFCNALGPGTRSVIWFYGCSKCCHGCIAGTMNEADEYESYTPEQLAEWVLDNNEIEGITLSGGEPMLHKNFCDFLRKANYTRMATSGLLKTTQGNVIFCMRFLTMPINVKSGF
jgi:pyruvate-formate lyase-activating enzyme